MQGKVGTHQVEEETLPVVGPSPVNVWQSSEEYSVTHGEHGYVCTRRCMLTFHSSLVFLNPFRQVSHWRKAVGKYVRYSYDI